MVYYGIPKYFWVIYLNDGKDTIYYAGYTADVCRVLHIQKDSLYTMASKGLLATKKYMVYRYLTSELDAMEDDYEGNDLRGNE